ncbi:nucleoside deaminase [Streptomyces thermolineatus]|uniref:Nucleoside deaminase n=1 Tax=Streptomyces thermolineatus TaxID=44033 RepID=A0ABP6A1G5_9ACTN
MPATYADLYEYARLTVDLSVRRVAEGGVPFAALVVRGDRVLGTGVDRVQEDRDPTAHAGMVALRRAAAEHGPAALAGSLLVASGEPCPLCYAAAIWCHVDQVVFAADRHTAASAGFDYTDSYALLTADPADWPMRATHLPVPGSRRPFDDWRARTLS